MDAEKSPHITQFTFRCCRGQNKLSNAAIQGIPFNVGHPWTNQFDLKADILAQTKIDDSNPMVVSLS